MVEYFKQKYGKDKYVTRFQNLVNKNPKMIRLIFADIYNGVNNSDIYIVRKRFNVSNPLEIPSSISFEEACKLISHISDKVKREDDVEDLFQIDKVAEMLKNCGFKEKKAEEFGYVEGITSKAVYSSVFDIFNDYKGVKAEPKLVDLISLGEKSNSFKKSNMDKRYFEWYTPNVTNKEFSQIMTKLHVANEDMLK